MKPAWRHAWDLTPREAIALQKEARNRVILKEDRRADAPVLSLAAIDVSYDRQTKRCAASLVLWDCSKKRILRRLTHVQASTFPYVPGLLSFREIPAILPLLERLRRAPDLLLCDGQGIAHPQRFGLATHLGVFFDCPALGWAKSRLIGEYADNALAREAGAAVALLDGTEQIGWVLRSRAGCRPTFVSPGHRLSLRGALTIARSLIGKYRICEPAREAHILTRRAMAGDLAFDDSARVSSH